MSNVKGHGQVYPQLHWLPIFPLGSTDIVSIYA